MIHLHDLDLPAVIEVRKRLLPETDGAMCIAKSLLYPSWCKDVKYAEGGVHDSWMSASLLREIVNKQFFSMLADNLPSGEIVFYSMPNLSALEGNWSLWRMRIRRACVKWAAKVI